MTIRRPFLAAPALTVLLLTTLTATASATVPPPPPVPVETVRGDIGDVVLTGLDGKLLTSGDGSTQFFVRLPKDSTCPGDSANDQWRVDSFLLPANEDPMDMVYTATGPEPPWTAGRYPLFATSDGLPISAQFLQRNSVVGKPGQILSIPVSSFAMVAENQFPGGEYTLGLICTYFNQPALYWDAGITISAAAADGDPTKLVWTLHPPEGGDHSIAVAGVKGDDTNWLLITTSAATALLLVIGVIRLRRSNRKHSKKETR